MGAQAVYNSEPVEFVNLLFIAAVRSTVTVSGQASGVLRTRLRPGARMAQRSVRIAPAANEEPIVLSEVASALAYRWSARAARLLR